SQLIHYLRRRRRMNELGMVLAHDELDLFAYYLDRGLYFEELPHDGKALIQILPYTEAFDSYYLFERGVRETPAPRPQASIPDTIRQIIGELEQLQQPGVTELACRLLDMSGETRDRFCSEFDAVRRRVRRDGRPHNFTFGLAGGSTGVTVFATKPAFLTSQARDLVPYMAHKAIEQGALDWFGVLTLVGARELIHSAVFIPDVPALERSLSGVHTK
ncbi:MAG TPA: hypothetical protein VML55_04020, partial [Planctomycetaceae bacterium]|nr:hypothetical protein [Planctomycetaceae bacterium]